MRVLSIDVGIKNLAICLIDGRSLVVHCWDLIELSVKSQNYAAAVKHALDEYMFDQTTNLILEDKRFDKIIIESQPGRNKRMLGIQHFIHMYFVCNAQTCKAPVIIFSPRNKLAGSGMENKGRSAKQYRARKKASVTLCLQWLEEHKHVNAAWLALLTRRGVKKDDYADTLNQALAYFKMHNILPDKQRLTHSVNETVCVIEKAIRCHKPTEKQLQKAMLSKSNVKYIVINELKLNKRSNKSTAVETVAGHALACKWAVHHFGSVEACLQQLL